MDYLVQIVVGDDFIEICDDKKAFAGSILTTDQATAIKEAFKVNQFWRIFIDSVKGSIIDED